MDEKIKEILTEKLNHSLNQNEDIEKLQKEVALKLGYKLVDHRLELYGSKIKNKKID